MAPRRSLLTKVPSLSGRSRALAFDNNISLWSPGVCLLLWLTSSLTLCAGAIWLSNKSPGGNLRRPLFSERVSPASLIGTGHCKRCWARGTKRWPTLKMASSGSIPKSCAAMSASGIATFEANSSGWSFPDIFFTNSRRQEGNVVYLSNTFHSRKSPKQIRTATASTGVTRLNASTKVLYTKTPKKHTQSSGFGNWATMSNGSATSEVRLRFEPSLCKKSQILSHDELKRLMLDTKELFSPYKTNNRALANKRPTTLCGSSSPTMGQEGGVKIVVVITCFASMISCLIARGKPISNKMTVMTSITKAFVATVRIVHTAISAITAAPDSCKIDNA